MCITYTRVLFIIYKFFFIELADVYTYIAKAVAAAGSSSRRIAASATG